MAGGIGTNEAGEIGEWIGPIPSPYVGLSVNMLLV